MASDLGYVVEERSIQATELQEWALRGEAFLAGTAAVISPVGTILADGESIQFGDGLPGANTMKLRDALVQIQNGKADDIHQWLTKVAG